MTHIKLYVYNNIVCKTAFYVMFVAILCDLFEPITLLKFGLFKKKLKKIAICSKN